MADPVARVISEGVTAAAGSSRLSETPPDFSFAPKGKALSRLEMTSPFNPPGGLLGGVLRGTASRGALSLRHNEILALQHAADLLEGSADLARGKADLSEALDVGELLTSLL